MRVVRSSLLVPAVLAAVVACSSTPAATPGAAPVTQTAQVNISGTGTTSALGQMVSGNLGQSSAVEAAPDAVYAALVDAYQQLGLPLSFKDDARRRAGNIGLKARRQVGKIAMRYAVDCGEDIAGPKADSYEVTLSIESSVVAGETAGTSTLGTVVSGSGRPVTTSGADVNCSSKGEIERSLQKAVRAKLGLR
jgi:hypothetical protein